MEITQLEKMMIAAKQQVLLHEAQQEEKNGICQWCFEEPAVDGKTICQSCIDSVKSAEEENKDFDLDEWLEEDEKC